MSSKVNAFLLVGAFFLLLNCTTKADPTSIIGVTNFGDDNSWRGSSMAQSFTTDRYSYINISFTLSLCNYSATNQNFFSLGLYRDNAGSQGNLITSLATANAAFFNNPAYSDYAFQNIVFTNNSVVLDPNTTYWVNLSNSNIVWNPDTGRFDNIVEWESLYSITTIGSGVFGNGTEDGSPYFSSNNPLNLTVTGTATVPEPFLTRSLVLER
jgi:hypothetical protein